MVFKQRFFKNKIDKDNKKDPYIGETFKYRYEVVRKLGKGSFGLVYLVNDTSIEMRYRIKRYCRKTLCKFLFI